MNERVDIQAFIKDYCAGIKEGELIARYGLSAKEIGPLVKKLINRGAITKEQYFNRNRIIAEREAREEKDFLQSLHHCPVCGHAHPTAFIRCPACGSSVSKKSEAEPQTGADQSTLILDGDALFLEEHDERSEASPTAAAREGQGVRLPDRLVEQARPPLTVVPTAQRSVEEVPEAILRMIGAPLDHVSLLPRFSDRLASDEYLVTGVIGNGTRSVALSASDGGKDDPDITVKVFHAEALKPAGPDELVEKLFQYQSVMDDRNIRSVLGRASLNEGRVLLYEYLPFNMEEIVRREPDGLPSELLIRLIPQLLNAVGYSHLHRGSNGLPTRLPHFSLKLSNIMLDRDSSVLKLDDCGVSRSFTEVKGHAKHLWQEPGVDLGSLAPEAFVAEGKYVNGQLVDIYALGVVLYRMATGKAPFSGANVEEYRFAHLKKYAVPPRVHRYDIPLLLDEMIMKCLEKEPDRRWRSATQMELSIGKAATR